MEQDFRKKRFTIPSLFVFGLVFTLCALGARTISMIYWEQGFSITYFGRIAISLVTAFWYCWRYHGYCNLTPEKQNIITLFFFTLIALCFVFSVIWPFKYWYILYSAILLLGTEKCIEIIYYRQKGAQDETNNLAKQKNQILVFTQHISIIRDLTFAFWWVLYGIVILNCDETLSDNMTMFFGLPYILLVAWYCIIYEKYKQTILFI